MLLPFPLFKFSIYMRVSRVSVVYLPVLILLYFPGFISAAEVTLKSIEIYDMHQWFKHEPTIYFRCNDGNVTLLPDVKEANVLLSFNGEESWQPLTVLLTKKCQRCGLYEKGLWTDDVVFDEWELCPSDFSAPDGIYTHFKEVEFNATFLCKECLDLVGDSLPSNGSSSYSQKGGGKTNYVAIVLISLAVAVVVMAGFVASFKYWRKRRRQQEQARFLKMFEEGDEMEDELGLGEGSL